MTPVFKIYYRDGETWEGSDVFAAPCFGVLIIVEHDPEHGRRLVTNGDYYIWQEKYNRWWPQDLVGLIDYLAQPGPRKVVIGCMVSNDEWNETFRRARADPDFPEQTAQQVYEVRGERYNHM